MQEYLSEAIVLNREASRDIDLRLSLFTKRFGKLVAKAKSARKITSKLSGHLEPGNLIQARLIEKNGLQVVDTLKKSKLNLAPVDLYLLDNLLADAEPDPRLWQMLLADKFNWPSVLKILGWDPTEAACHLCGSRKPTVFNIRGQEFFCASCSLKLSRKELLYIQ